MASLTYFSVTADMLAVVGAAGTPSTVPIRGKVTFTPMIKSGDALVLTTLSPRPGLVSPQPVTGVIGSDGQLGFGGSVGVRLIADTSVLGLTSPLFYTVDFVGLTVNGQPRQLTSFEFQAAQSDTPINLANVARVPGQPASGVVNTPLPNRVRLNGSNQVVFSANGVDLPDPLPIEGFDADLAAIAALAPADGDVIQRVSGSWLNRTVAQLKTALNLANVDNTSDVNKPVSTAQQTALNGKMSPLTAVAAVTINTNPTVGVITPYNTSTASLTGTLPALSGLNVGDRTGFKKYLPTGTLDLGYTVTVSCAGADTFYGGGTTAVLKLAGEFRELMVISISGTKYFTTVSALNPLTASDNRYSDLAPIGNGPFAGVVTKLNHNQSAVLQFIGDSTVVGLAGGTGGWVGRIGDILGAYGLYDASVWSCLWNDTNQSYDPPTVRRTSTQGDRKVAANGLTHVNASVTGDLEVIARINVTNLVPYQAIAAKYDIVTGNFRGWIFGIGNGVNGKLSLYWSPDGTSGAQIQAVATAAVPFAINTDSWVRATLQVNNGSGGYTVTFYTSTDGTTWTPLGSAVTAAGVTSIYDNSTIPYILGTTGIGNLATAAPLQGTIAYVRVGNGLANGVDMVPRLPEAWDNNGTAVINPVLTGGPMILLMVGAKGGQTLSYYDDDTRRPKLLSARRPDVVFTADGHNDFASPPSQFAAAYLTYVRRVAAFRPNVPIIVTTQNPEVTGSGTTPQSILMQSMRVAATARVLCAEPGVTVLDTAQAYTNTATQIESAGIHPTDVGYQAQAVWMMARLAPRTVL